MDSENIELKSDAIEFDKRIAHVFELLCQGYNTPAIIENCLNVQKYNVSERQIYNYIKKASEKYIECSDFDKQTELGKSITRLGLLFSRCLAIQDYKTALQVQRELNDMLGFKNKTASKNKEVPKSVLTSLRKVK